MDGVVDPAFAVAMGKLGGLAVLNLEGIQTRYEDPAPQLDAIASYSKEEATARMQEIYAAEQVKPELVKQRVAEIKAGGVPVAASLTPQNVERFIEPALEGGLDILIIQGTVVSAEHVSSYDKPLDLNAFIAGLDIPVIVGGCCSYQGALHLMRTAMRRQLRLAAIEAERTRLHELRVADTINDEVQRIIEAELDERELLAASALIRG